MKLSTSFGTVQNIKDTSAFLNILETSSIAPSADEANWEKEVFQYPRVCSRSSRRSSN